MAEQTLRVRWIVNTHFQLDGVIRKRTQGDVDYLPIKMAEALLGAQQVKLEEEKELVLPDGAELFLEGFGPQLSSEGEDEHSSSSDS